MLRRQPVTLIESGTTSHDLALIQYTAGMTGLPKGVMLSHGNLMTNTVQLCHLRTDASRGHEVILSMFPLSHIYGITTGMNAAIALGGSLLLVPTTNTDVVLTAVEVQEAFEKLTRGHLIEAYGLTEASPLTHANPYKSERGTGSIGLPLPSTNARIVDLETGEPLLPGGVGELLIRGPQVMQGYWQMPEETARALYDGWLRTNDVVQMDEDGFFTFIDRKQNLTLSGTHKIYPREVEEVLYEHPKVLEVAVVSMMPPAEKDGRNPTGALSTPSSPFIRAFVVVKRGQRVTADELLAYARERLEDYKVPHQIEFRTELPKNAVGKIVRGMLFK